MHWPLVWRQSTVRGGGGQKADGKDRDKWCKEKNERARRMPLYAALCHSRFMLEARFEETKKWMTEKEEKALEANRQQGGDAGSYWCLWTCHGVLLMWWKNRAWWGIQMCRNLKMTSFDMCVCVCVCRCTYVQRPNASILIRPSSRCCLLNSWSINNHSFWYSGEGGMPYGRWGGRSLASSHPLNGVLVLHQDARIGRSCSTLQWQDADVKVFQLAEGADEVQFILDGPRTVCDQLETCPGGMRTTGQCA